VYVRLARVLADGTWEPAEQECLLEGHGRGSMLIAQAPRDYHRDGYPIVLVAPSASLPGWLTIGWVESSRARPQAPLHYDLVVKPWGQARRLSHVYVISTGS